MKAGDIVATTGNRFIQASTVSRWSHVALAIDEDRVVEAIPNKVVIRPLKDCISTAKTSYLFERPSELSTEEKEALIKHVSSLEKQGLNYCKLRAGYSGVPYILKNFFCTLAIIQLLGAGAVFFFWDDIDNSYPLLLLAVISVFIGLPLSNLAGMTKQNNEWLERIGAPKWLKNNTKDQFCSQLVEEIDKKISPSFSLAIKADFESRPKDVVYACERLRWNKKNITKQSSTD
ncbi:hypothetical protein ACK1CN_09565 [Vibrio coralliilyticus]|uniref:hypothetical protein n=1 Tax=Vibrio coralliilyticus TaxID=190893 RepID=UPI003916D02A